MTGQAARRPLLLMILDGWGFREDGDANAIRLAATPFWDEVWRDDPHGLIETSGEAVGLPAGQMGNSEVGHMNIGAGRVVFQDYSRIENAIRDGSFGRNPQIQAAVRSATAAGGRVHVMGLLSPGGVHSHDDHFLETVRVVDELGAQAISVHAFLDGRDTPPRSAETSIRRVQELLNTLDGASLDTLSGRYYAMDRDKRWERVEQAYHAIVDARAEYHADNAVQGLQAAYARGESDEFVKPTVVGQAAGVHDGDAVIFINFRADRARELTMAFVTEDFDGFERPRLKLSAFVCMTEYMAGLPVAVAFPPEPLQHLLGGELADHGLRQLRIAETEKYAHVTFFFNGGEEQPFPGEERILVPSPRVATYDLQPEMSLPELTDRLVDAIGSAHFDVIICNVANPDMVGHTGDLDAAIAAVEAVDRSLARVAAAIDAAGGEMLITADHGNIEQMTDPDSGQEHTAHTTNKVPLLFHGRPAHVAAEGSLRDIAPTMLALLGLPQPAAMTGKSLLVLEGDRN